MSLEALIFDVDGTLAETEELHRRAFNRTFVRLGLDFEWDRPLYTALLQTTGGKERFIRYIEDYQPERRDLLERVGEVHAEKSRAYLELLRDGALGLRPGVARLITQARAEGVKLAVATTTTPENVAALLASTLGPESPGWFAIAAGDMVARKKPDPAVYAVALKMLVVEPQNAIAFEDSVNGINAARAAGLGAVVATPSLYLKDEDLSAATAVVSDLGEPRGPAEALGGELFAAGYVDLDGLRALLPTDRPAQAD
jgi:beta-phosphoglucomutase-like phosphatase (HAD superfamily)